MHSLAQGAAASLRPQDRKLRRREASDYLQTVHGVPVAVATLEKLACIGGGPKFHKAGRYPLYPTSELDRWAEARLGRLVGSTSEVATATAEAA